ncbi:MAG: 2-oxoacid:acceptor oxidoreductase subunit alpha [Candidatus Promineifilaceae bacterium]
MVNDFSIVAATVNGTGSQTANLVLFRALANLGIQVSGKNIFPSNIQGSPTWYHIRLSERGFEAFRRESEILIAFNKKTFDSDLLSLLPAGVCVYPDHWPIANQRTDVTYYALPVNSLLRNAGVTGRSKEYLANMLYVGALGHLLGIDLSVLEDALDHQFKGRTELFETNMEMVSAAYLWTKENLDKVDSYVVKAAEEHPEQILITGNEAAALGAIFGGVGLVSWYPITPSTSLIDALSKFLPELRTDPDTGKATYAVIQAEDELSAIGMVIGAGWAGARAMTATSGPGISLMTEFAGLGYFAEVPAVIWDVQRVGPSTGMPTRTAQGDILSVYFLGHGDTTNVMLFPGTVAECFAFGCEAFDLAEELQTPVFVLSDLDLGMNTWTADPFDYPSQPMNRGKVLTAQEVNDLGFSRFSDLDGDGIAYRTLPGNEHPMAAYLSRGTGHDQDGLYSEKADDWEENMERLNRKFETARLKVPKPVIEDNHVGTVGFIAFGSTVGPVQEARTLLEDKGRQSAFMRIRALPFSLEVRDFIDNHDLLFVIELNRDGQMHKLLSMEYPELDHRMLSLSRSDGMPMTASWILAQIEQHLNTNEHK